MKRFKGLYILEAASVDLIYGPAEQKDIAGLVDIYAAPQTSASIKSNLALLSEADLIFSGWGAPIFDESLLNAAPGLRAIFYGAGSIRSFTTPAFWSRNITITSAYAANAVPVSEYTLSVIVLSLKQFWKYSSLAKRGLGWGDHTRPLHGNFNATVGFVSFGMIARKVVELLLQFDLKPIVYCPFLSHAEASALGVTLCTLEEVFQKSDVVSLHTPDIPATRGLITGALISSMKPEATLINSARGAIINQPQMIEVLRARPDLTAVLDVTSPEPPEPDCPLLALPNVVLSPHIAGSMGSEIQRLGRYMVDELRRYLAGEPLKWQITRELADKLA